MASGGNGIGAALAGTTITGGAGIAGSADSNVAGTSSSLSTAAAVAATGEVLEAPRLLRDGSAVSDISRDSIAGLKEAEWAKDPSQAPATEILVILKWGGDLTPLGRDQAESMGAIFRQKMYPDNNNGGVLRLHATYRHDLKIKASDEGRVMKTAAAFAKGLLELEGQLTPILASLVTIEEKNRQMLDHGGNKQVKEDLDRCVCASLSVCVCVCVCV
eukprot:GSChrysophyteH2.ASY1.ANO1.1023.1 assembled CDS